MTRIAPSRAISASTLCGSRRSSGARPLSRVSMLRALVVVVVIRCRVFCRGAVSKIRGRRPVEEKESGGNSVLLPCRRRCRQGQEEDGAARPRAAAIADIGRDDPYRVILSLLFEHWTPTEAGSGRWQVARTFSCSGKSSLATGSADGATAAPRGATSRRGSARTEASWACWRAKSLKMPKSASIRFSDTGSGMHRKHNWQAISIM